jgi:hypothetical protein
VDTAGEDAEGEGVVETDHRDRALASTSLGKNSNNRCFAVSVVTM